MTKRERVMKAVVGEPVDHAPAGFWFHFPEEEFFGDAAVRAHLAYCRESDVDLFKIMNERLLRFEEPIRVPSDWRRLKRSSLNQSYYREQIDLVKRIVDEVPGDPVRIATVHGVFASAFHASKSPGECISGENRLMEHLRTSPQDVLAGFRVVADVLLEFSRACLKAGAEGLYYAALGGEDYRFSEEEFREYLAPFDLEVLKPLEKDCGVLVLHICKDKVRLPQYADYPGHVVNWAVHDSSYPLEKGREIFKRTILGGLDDRSGVMVNGGEAAVEREAGDIIRAFGKTGFILGCDCTLPTDVPIEHIRAAVRAARDI